MIRKANPGRRGAVAFIFITVVLDVMAGTMVFPVMPTLIATVSAGDATHVAGLFGALTTLFFAMQFAASPVQGALSDAYGRRPIILASCFGLGVDSIIVALAPDAGWLFAGRLIAGVLAGSMTAANAWLADVTPAEERAKLFGYFFAAMGLGQSIGPAVGGWLATFGIRAPFWVAAGLSLINGLYGLLILPESLPKERRTGFTTRDFNPAATMLALRNQYPHLLPWAFVMLAFALGATGINVIFVLYTGYRYAWTPRDIGLLLTFYGLGVIAVQTGLVPILSKRLGDMRTMFFGYALEAAAIAGCGFAATSAEFWMCMALLCVGVVASPAQSAIVSRLVAPADQGKLAGATRSLYNLAAVAGPALFTFVFARAVAVGGKDMSGAPFLLAAIFFALAGGAAALFARRRPAAM